MQNFVENLNIEKFKAQIEVETDPVRLALLRTLLSEEETKRALMELTERARIPQM